MSIELESLDRDVGLASRLPYWQEQIRLAQAGLAVASHVKPRHVEGLMRSHHGTLDALSTAEFRRSVARHTGTANITQATMLDMIANSWGIR